MDETSKGVIAAKEGIANTLKKLEDSIEKILERNFETIFKMWHQQIVSKYFETHSDLNQIIVFSVIFT